MTLWGQKCVDEEADVLLNKGETSLDTGLLV